ncbi:hypothetical protein [Erwinia aphidicola]|uniref:hypothetical protein n=1 Tax=Erwinia aphidicola TaxID=68334 RepID=UPI003D2424F6
MIWPDNSKKYRELSTIHRNIAKILDITALRQFLNGETAPLLAVIVLIAAQWPPPRKIYYSAHPE